LVEKCIRNIKLLCPEFTINILSKENISNYVDLSEVNEKLEIAVKADYIRLYLLNRYGGIWLDSSIYLVENLDWIFKNSYQNSCFLFFSDHCTVNLDSPIVENWFIATSKNNEFINDWFNEFKKCIFSSDPTSFYSNMKYNTDIIQNIPNTNYLMCYISAAIIRSKKKYNLYMLNSGAHGHYYNYSFYSINFIIALKLLILNTDFTYKPKLIKFTKDSRKWPNIFIKYNIYCRKSLIGSSIYKNSHCNKIEE
ncbi:glycosyltransferase family 32 protein, partial [Acinetobacter ursingii]|uniref:glycosyltransferase family 32 protein n=1 Tax=Acinetobacter ursingii TaxID=108980 RepID=UPI0012506341